MKKNHTVKCFANEAKLDRIFHALADPTRRSIIARLADAEGTVSALAEPFEISLNAVSKHLKVLESAQLIDREIVGRTSICSLNADVLQDAMIWIDQYTVFWEESLDALEVHMEQQTGSVFKTDPKEKS